MLGMIKQTMDRREFLAGTVALACAGSIDPTPLVWGMDTWGANEWGAR